GGSRHVGGGAAPRRSRRPASIRPGSRRTPPGRRAARRRRRPALVWAGVVTAVVVAGVLLVVNRPWFAGTATTVRVSVLSNVDGAASSDPTAPLRLRFSQPLDHAATASAVRLSPATQVRSAWDGDTLTVTPVYGFTPNSAYVLTVD